MHGFDQIVKNIRKLRKNCFIHDLKNLLLSANNLRDLTRHSLIQMSDQNFIKMALESNLGNLEPKHIPLHIESDESFSILLNYFDNKNFEKLSKRGEIKVHGHRFSFVSVILRGFLEHAVYKFNGTSWKLESQKKFKVGEIYSLSKTYCHQVTSIAPDTITLMICGRPKTKMRYVADPRYNSLNALNLKDRLINLLKKPI